MSFTKLVEQIVRIVRTRSGFGVVLHAENRVVAEAETFERLVVQVDVGDLRRRVRLSESGSTAKPWLWDVISTF